MTSHIKVKPGTIPPQEMKFPNRKNSSETCTERKWFSSALSWVSLPFRVTSLLISEKTIKLLNIHTFPIMNVLGFLPNSILSYCFSLKVSHISFLEYDGVICDVLVTYSVCISTCLNMVTEKTMGSLMNDNQCDHVIQLHMATCG